MIEKRVFIAIVFPLLLLAALKVLGTFFQSIDLFVFDSMITSLMKVVYSWPLMAIEATGYIPGNIDVFYNEWENVSLMFSLSIQILVVFIMYKPEQEDA